MAGLAHAMSTPPYTATCPECHHPWVKHRAVSSVRITPPEAAPQQRVRLACNNGCGCYGQQLPAPPAIHAGRPMIPRIRRRKPIEA